MDATHTPGKLVFKKVEREQGNYDINSDEGFFVAETIGGFGAGEEANARRLVACWNACDGLYTESLERGKPLADQLVDALNQRDALLDALQHIQRCIPLGGFAQIHHGSSTWDQIDAAIAKATGVQS